MPLKIVKRPKSPNLYIRGTVAGVYIEESTGTSDRSRAEYLRAKRESELLDISVYGAKKTATFAEAAISYMKAGREKRFILPLLKHFGTSTLASITQTTIEHAAEVLYPNASPATHIRHVYTPVTSIITRAAKAGLCERVKFERPKVTRKPVAIPHDRWWDAIEATASPNLWALLVFMSNTGTRVSEALRLKWDDVDTEGATALLGMTKNGTSRQVDLNPLVLLALVEKRTWEKTPVGERFASDQVFSFSDKQNVYRSLRSACARARVPYYSTHPAGRHTFAKRILKAGHSLKLLQEAGGWADMKTPAMNYGHLEGSQVRSAVMKLGENQGNKKGKSK